MKRIAVTILMIVCLGCKPSRQELLTRYEAEVRLLEQMTTELEKDKTSMAIMLATAPKEIRPEDQQTMDETQKLIEREEAALLRQHGIVNDLRRDLEQTK